MHSAINEKKGCPAAKGALRAGAARVDITIREAGLAVHDPLFAKALALECGNIRAVIVTLDAVAVGGIADIPDDFLPRLRERLERELGIPQKNVLVNASHTHPANRLVCADLLERVFCACRRAYEGLEPVTAGVGSGREDRIIINRTLRLKSGRDWTIRHSIPCPPDEEVESVGPIDPEIGLLRLDRADGSTLAVLYNYACHTLIGVPSGAITANFPAFASRVIEDNLPGSTALFIQGAAGDVTELLYKDVNRPRDARPLGEMLGLSALAALRQIKTLPADLAVLNEPLALPRLTERYSNERIAEYESTAAELLASLRFCSLNLKTFIPLYLKHKLDPEHPADYVYHYLQEKALGIEDLKGLDAENARNLEKYLHNLGVMEKLSRLVDDIETLKKHREENLAAGGRPIPTEVMGLRVGDFTLITSPAELLTEVGLRLKRLSPRPHTYVSAFTNGYIHYGAPAEYYPRGGYEVTECHLAPEWHELYEKKALDVLGNL